MKSEIKIRASEGVSLPSKKNEILGLNIMKYTQDIDEKNHEIHITEIKEINKGKESPCSWIKRYNIVKRSVLLNLSSRFRAIPAAIL